MKSGQVWVETVIYTLIGLSLIAVVLTLITPKINEFRDKSVIEQTLSSFNAIDSKIEEVISGGVGNARIVEFSMKRGNIYFDKQEDSIYFILEDSEVVFSEPGVETQIGKVKVLTESGTASNKVTLKLDYDFDLNFQNDEEVLQFTPSTIPYKFRFENKGYPVVGGRQELFFQETS